MTADIIGQRRAILDLLEPRDGETAVDVGSGPGFLAVELATRVGPSGAVLGVEPSENMLAAAARRAAPICRSVPGSQRLSPRLTPRQT
ncbi:MAG: hypothetical protein DLM58_06795 [Pseudonocardiales bacterium]|nr:MAG: hypothetical protein DLM58_06795 [Pseudonocardiales bacterium]